MIRVWLSVDRSQERIGMLTLNDIIEALTGIRPEGLRGEIVTAAIDSREVVPGALFIALSGEREDGHDYVSDAFDHGAVCALVDQDMSSRHPQVDLRTGYKSDYAAYLENPPICLRVNNSLESLQQIAYYWRRKHKVKVIGITGSVGKSTTKELVAEVESRRYRTLKSAGNLNNEIGLPLTLLNITPEHERVVLEMGFYIPGEIKFLCDLALPEVGVVTNVGTVHAERAGSIEVIALGKSELIQSLPSAPVGVAILNYDDTRVREMAGQTQAKVFFYGLDSHADLWADGVEGLGLDGIRFRMHYRNEILYMKVPMIGRHSVHTALRAAAVGLVDGLTWQEIVDGLRSGQAQLRLVVARSINGAVILDDTYNASPESTLAALNLLEDLEGRKIAVLGDMLELGQYEWRGHEMVGVRAAEVVDELVTVGERGRMIAAAASRAGLSNHVISAMDNNHKVIELLEARLQPNDVVLVKGSRGMQMEEIVSALEAKE